MGSGQHRAMAQRMKQGIAAIVAGLIGCAMPAAAAVPSAEMLAGPCAGCHGPGGVSIGAIPSIHGYPKEVIVSAMLAFRDGSRPQTVMAAIASAYTDEEIDALGDYFSSLP